MALTTRRFPLVSRSIFARVVCPSAAGLVPSQRRALHVALVAEGVGDSLASLHGARQDKQASIHVPVPDPKLERLAVLERTTPVQAVVEVAPVEAALVQELAQAIEAEPSDAEIVEVSGKLLAALRSADAVVLAVPCPGAVTEGPVRWLQAAERALISVDLETLEKQICKSSDVGPEAVIDGGKLTKSMSNAKDPLVRREADTLTRDVLIPGFQLLRTLLQAGTPAREARSGLAGCSADSQQLHPRFEELAQRYLHLLVTWKPLLVLADVEVADVAAADDVTPFGNASCQHLAEHLAQRGLPCLTTCTALEGEVAGMRDDPDFLQEYLESCGLKEGQEGDPKLRPWISCAAELTRRIPPLLNLLTYYTAGDKEARAWMCPRVRRDGSSLAFELTPRTSLAPVSVGKAGGPKGTPGKGDDEGVPAALAARAIHTGFESRVKGLELWRFQDLDELGPSDASGAKERAKIAGKARKLPAMGVVQESDVVEFALK